MKLGLGLYKSLLTADNFRFAKQAGATHLVVQLVDYVQGGDNPSLSRNYLGGWGITTNREVPWDLDLLTRLKQEIEAHGLTWEILENLDPAHWYDVLLDGPGKAEQLESLKQLLKNLGKAGIKVLGYLFSIAGVWGWTSSPTGRGGAVSVGYHGASIDPNQPIPNGMVWNMTYDPEAPSGYLAPISRTELMERYRHFLETLLPVAEENNVILAAHPDDPPVSNLRGQPRLFYSQETYHSILDIASSPNHQFEFCLGTLQEMQGSNVYELLETLLDQNRIAYIHFRNVKGKVPDYSEVFVDEGDLDMVRVMKILHQYNYDGVIIPDHTPEMSCKAPWHAGMAYALGYMKGTMQSIEKLPHA